MGRDTLTLVVLYTNLSTKRFEVDTRQQGREIVHNEGDHVMDYYWEEKKK